METIEHGSKTTRYVETKVIPLALLTKHPDAEAFGADVEDRTAQASSVTDVGLLDPVAVMFEDDRYLILDGCGRYDAMQAAGAEQVLCMVVELHGITPREYAMHRNTMGRRVTTGQRLMCYLAINQTQVMEAAEDKGGGDQRALRSRDRSAYSSRAVAERLGVSDKDVRAGIDLLRASAAADEEDGGKFVDIRNQLLAGSLPIRRWRPAMAGKWAPQRGRADVNHADVFERGLNNLKTGLSKWREIPAEDRAIFEKRWHEEIAPLLPEVLR